MTTVERLQRDHAIFRAKLMALESAYRFGAEARFVIREICFSLSQQLRDHRQREEGLAAAYHRALRRVGSASLERLAIDHGEEWDALRFVNRCFAQESDGLFEYIRPTIGWFIDGLRHRMDEQEKRLFPFLAQIASDHRPNADPTAASRIGLTETLRGDEIIRKHPETRDVFDRFFVDIDQEGYYSIDEIACRHGIDSQKLLADLASAVAAARQRTPRSPRQRMLVRAA